VIFTGRFFVSLDGGRIMAMMIRTTVAEPEMEHIRGEIQRVDGALIGLVAERVQMEGA
jgi:hypothetical protein